MSKTGAIATAGLVVAVCGCGSHVQAPSPDRARARAALLRLSDLPRGPWLALSTIKTSSGCRTAVPRRLIRFKLFSPTYARRGSQAASIVIVYSSGRYAEVALRQIEGASFRRCYIRKLRSLPTGRLKVLSIVGRRVQGFQAPPGSATTRYIMGLTTRGAVVFQVNDVFYFRVRAFLGVLTFATFNRFPQVPQENAVFTKLRARLLENAR